MVGGTIMLWPKVSGKHDGYLSFIDDCVTDGVCLSAGAVPLETHTLLCQRVVEGGTSGGHVPFVSIVSVTAIFVKQRHLCR